MDQIKKTNPNFTIKTLQFGGYDKLNLNSIPSISNYQFLKDHPKIRNISISQTYKKPDFTPLYHRNWKELTINNEQLNSQDLANMVSSETNYLNIDKSSVTDLNFLKNKYLSRLSLNHTAVKDISVLKNMTTLKHLEIHNTNIKNLFSLNKINLESLIFSPAQFDNDSLRLLRQKISLKMISPSPQSPMLKAQQFWINYIEGQYGKPLQEFLDDEATIQNFYTDLKKDNPEAIKGFVLYRPPGYLDISGNESIKNLTFLKKYPNISNFRLKFISNELNDFNPIFDRPILKSLVVEYSNFDNKDLGQCSRFEELNTLSLTGSKVNNIFPIKNLKLKRLFLNDLKIKDLSPLRGMTSLETLDISDTLVKNLTHLKNLNLKQLGFTPEQYSLDQFRTIVKMRSIEEFLIDGQLIPIQVFWGKYFKGDYGRAHMELRDEFILGIQLFSNIAKENPNYKGFKNFENLVFNIQHGKLYQISMKKEGLENSKLTQIDFLKKYPDLTHLNLNGCVNIKDFSPILHLKKLKHLSLEKCSNFKDLLLLKDLPIETLILNDLPDLKLQGLEKLKNLKHLEIISHHDFKNLNGLSLRSIAIDTTHKNLNALIVLKEMTSLIEIRDKNYPDNHLPTEFWKALSTKQQLEKDLLLHNPDLELSKDFNISNRSLSLKNCKNLIDISFLKKYEGLEILTLEKADLLDYSALQHLHHLEYLNLNSSSFKQDDLLHISSLKNLKSLYLGDTQISSFEPLKNLPLEKLQISQVKVKDFGPLSHIKNLKSLYMEEAIPQSLIFLSNLHQLETLRFTPKILPPEFIKRIYSLKQIENIGVRYGTTLPRLEFWQNYFSGKYGEVYPELQQRLDLEKELIFHIQKDNPNFLPDQYFRVGISRDRVYELHLGHSRSSLHPLNSLKNISFLEHYPELNSLKFYHCPNIKNYDALKKLKKLNTIGFYGITQFNDLSLLKNIPISKLYLGLTTGLDFSHLKNKKIEYLSFVSKGNQNVDILKNVTSLHTIDDETLPKTKHTKKYWELFDNYQDIISEITTYNPNITLPLLDVELQFDGSIKRLAFNYPKGRGQSLNNTLANLSFLKKYHQIDEFAITANEAITDFSALKYLRDTRELSLVNTHFNDLHLISHLPLRTLYINDTGVKDLAPIKEIKLVSLNILGQKGITSLKPLQEMHSLNTLIMPFCSNIRDLTPLKNLNLEKLIFHPQYIKKGLSVVQEMDSIKEISTETQKLHRPELFWNRVKKIN